MSDRREFVSATVAALTAARSPRARGRRRVSVEARTSVFYSHPNGERTLVRFVVRDTDAPAGRMRVFDNGRRLLGTAGVIARGGRELYGELWFPLQGELGVVSELELPGLRTPIRTPHSLRPQRRWSIHWVTIVDPDELMQRLAGLSTLELGIQTALMADAAVGGNPHPLRNGPSELMDNLPFLRSAAGALELELRYGIPSSPIALA